MNKHIPHLILSVIFGFLLAITAGHVSGSENPGVTLLQTSPITNPEDELTFFFYSASDPVHFLVVEKQTQKLMLFEQLDTVKLLKTFTSATGENPGTKMTSGDSRTPEGLYYITEIYEDSKITVFGSRAFHLDYPNAFDRQAGRDGNGIFIHGTNKTLIPYSTNGCITLNNETLDELAPYLTVNTIPVIVVNALNAPITGRNLRLMKNDSRFNDILAELSVDSEEFEVDNINSLYFLQRGSQAIAAVNYSVYDGDFLQYQYLKRIYLTPAITKEWRHLYAVERQATVPAILALHPIKNKGMEITARPKNKGVGTKLGKELHAFVEKWRTAWTSKDTDTYIDCYSPSFRSGQLDRDGWRRKKSYLNNKYRYIKVSIRNIDVELTDSGANVTFFQDYQSDKYKVSGTKFLQLINKDNRWMIQKEVM